MTNSLGVYVDNLEAEDENKLKEKLYNIKNRFDYQDFVIFTDSFILNNLKSFSTLSTFYLKFFKGTIVFLDDVSFNKYKDATLAKSVIYEELS